MILNNLNCKVYFSTVSNMDEKFLKPKNYTIVLTCKSGDNANSPFISSLTFSNYTYEKTESFSSSSNGDECIVTLKNSINEEVAVKVECYNILNGSKISPFGNQDISCVFNSSKNYRLGCNKNADVYFAVHFITPVIQSTINYLVFKFGMQDKNTVTGINSSDYYSGSIHLYSSSPFNDELENSEEEYTYTFDETRNNFNVLAFNDIEKFKISSNEVSLFLNKCENCENLIIPIIGNNSRNDDEFTVKFSSLRLGQTVQTENISIEGCTFVRDVETHKGIRGYKVFTDNATGAEVKLDFYTDSNVSHAIDETILYNYRYLINHTEYDSLNISCRIFQNGADLTGRKIIYNQNLPASDCFDAEITTLYNGFIQSSESKKISPWNYTIPATYEMTKKYIVIITLSSENPMVFGLYNASFPYLTFKNVVSQSSALYDNTEIIQFENTKGLQSTNVVCEVYESTKKNRLSIYTSQYQYAPSDLFNPNVSQNGESIVLSASDRTEFKYIMTFRNSIPVESMKGFKIGIGENSGNYECNVNVKIYDQMGYKLVYEKDFFNSSREVLEIL